MLDPYLEAKEHFEKSLPTQLQIQEKRPTASASGGLEAQDTM
ncbi:MAG: hypothetical protein ACOH5I_14770 [Oligoflexus sp.]